MNEQNEIKNVVDQPIGNAEKVAAQNDVFEAYGLKLQRYWAKLSDDMKIQKVSEAEAKAKYLASDSYKKMVLLMEHDVSLKENIAHACNWFNEIKILNVVEKHYKSGCVASRAHRNTDISLMDEFMKQTLEVAKTANIDITELEAREISCRYVLQMTPCYEVI